MASAGIFISMCLKCEKSQNIVPYFDSEFGKWMKVQSRHFVQSVEQVLSYMFVFKVNLKIQSSLKA